MAEEEATLEERQDNLMQELKDRCIRRELWASIGEGAEGIRTVEELDAYLDRMERNHSRFQ